MSDTATPCARCKVNPGTVRWGDTLALTHGWAAWWCERCATEVQLAHAEERAALIPEMREKLAALGGPMDMPSDHERAPPDQLTLDLDPEDDQTFHAWMLSLPKEPPSPKAPHNTGSAGSKKQSATGRTRPTSTWSSTSAGSW